MERQQEEGLGSEGRLTRGGRASALSIALFVLALLVGFAALHVLELAPPAAPPVPEPEPDREGGLVRTAWTATVELDGTSVRARLVPLHEEAVLQSFRADSLRERFELGPGAPWRLLLALAPGAPATLAIRAASVRDAAGERLRPLRELVSAPPEGDPVWALFGGTPGLLEEGFERPLLLWGDAPREGDRLEVTCDGASGSAELLREDSAVAVARSFAGEPLDDRGAPRTAEEEVALLRSELLRERALRAEREQDFREFHRILDSIPRGGATAAAPAATDGSEDESAAPESADPARERAEEIGRSLGVLMRIEGLRGMDLMEVGTLQEGAVGPVVFRCFDERGQLAGSVSARRLRLEGSRAAHTLTLVLEDGFESRSGERVPFATGARRIVLSDVDPAPWFESCPELFGGTDLASPGDDGAWDLGAVRRELNALLALDPSVGWYRMHSLGGVRGSAWLDVQLEELDANGRLRRRLFGDRMSLGIEDGSVVLELEDGATVRGSEKQPFRDGRFRIVLPGAAREEWQKARLPGLAEPPAKPAPEKAPASDR